eukprot:scaffold79604_cov18-Tisochrysis_lutea.AAC.3
MSPGSCAPIASRVKREVFADVMGSRACTPMPCFVHGPARLGGRPSNDEQIQLVTMARAHHYMHVPSSLGLLLE